MKLSLPGFVHHFLPAKTKMFLWLMFLTFGQGLGAQVTWFVKSNPGGNNTGLDWENAFLNPQDAFDKAGHGDQIYIQSGSYMPVRNLKGQSNPDFRRDYTFHLHKNLKIYGSFEGNEASHWDRNFSEPSTIFSGDLNGDDIGIDDLQSEFFPLQNDQDNVYQVLIVDGRVSSVLLDGIQISGGNATSHLAGSGAAMFFQHNENLRISVDINKCMFTKNSAIEMGAAIYLNALVENVNITHSAFHSNRADRDGAGIYIRSHQSGKLNISETRFSDHFSNQGAAILVESLRSFNLSISGADFINNVARESGGALRFTTTRNLSNLAIERSSFLNNIAGFQGGAIYTDQTAISMQSLTCENNAAFDGGFSFSTALEEYDILIVSSAFMNNIASNTGACFSAYNASLEVSESLFTGHGKPLVGGVFYLYHTVPKTRLNSVLVDNCIFEKNEAVKGAVFFEAAVNQHSRKDNALFLRSRFRNNKAEEGGVFFISQNIPVNKVFNRTYYSCVFADNTASSGGVQYYISSAAADDFFLNCTFYNNKASEKDPLFFYDIPDGSNGRSVLDIINSILWRNFSANQNTFIESNPNFLISLFNSLIDRQDCEDLRYPVQCSNNIYNQDPLFFNVLAGDLRLRICSPAIDKGDNPPVLFPIFPTTDIIRRARIINDIVDMGAYEVPQPYFAVDTIYICPGDSLWHEAIGWIQEPGIYLDTMGILNGCVDEHAYFALTADTIAYNIETMASDCSYDGIEIVVNSTSDVDFEWRQIEDITLGSSSVKIQSTGWYYLFGSGDSFCPLVDSIYIDSIPRMPIFTTDVLPINCLEKIGRIELQSNDDNFRISWEGPDGVTGNSAIHQTLIPGIYTAMVRDALDCPYDFRIEIVADTISPEAIILEETFNPCLSDPRVLNAKAGEDPNLTYEWTSNGGIWEPGTDQFNISAISSGLYYFNAVNAENGCEARDSIEVRIGAGEVVPLMWDETQSGCGDQFTLSVKLTGIDGGVEPYQLFVDGLNMDINNYAQIKSGSHIFSIVDWAGCEWDSTFNVNPTPNLVLDLGPDLTVKPGRQLELFVHTEIPSEQLQFTWNNNPACIGCSSLPLQIFNDTMIIVSAALNQDCIASDTLLIYILEDPRIFIPTAFSPNGDGINDVLEFFPGDNVRQVFSLRIYNRWGNLVFDGANCQEPGGCKWDGKYKSMALDPQQLVWSMKLEMKNGTIHQLQGEVAIIK